MKYTVENPRLIHILTGVIVLYVAFKEHKPLEFIMFVFLVPDILPNGGMLDNLIITELSCNPIVNVVNAGVPLEPTLRL